MRSTLRFGPLTILIALALTSLLATGAHADLVYHSGGDDLPTSEGAQTAFLNNLLAPSTVLFKLEDDTNTGPVILSAIDSETGTVSWDFTGLGISIDYIVVVDGNVNPGQTPPTVVYNVFQVINGQNISSGGIENIWCCGLTAGAEPFREISHVTFLGGAPTNGVPEPATMLLLGSGLVGAALVGRKFAR